MGAKNNDSTSQKQAIVIFYTMEYRKCGNPNQENDCRLYLGASVILKSVDFTVFTVNVKTIAPTQNLYQSGHAIWCGRSAAQLMGSLLPDIHNNRSISLHYSSYFTTSIFAVPSAKNEIPSASCFVYMVAVITCSPSPTKTSTLKRSNIILNLSSPFGLLTRARR